MTLAQAQLYADKIVNWLSPCPLTALALPCIIAGSIRRQRPICNDVDIVCIPKFEEIKDMFQNVESRKNLLADFLVSYAGRAPGATIKTNGPRQLLIDLPKCQLDLWFADEKNLATRLLCRTGSMQHNVWLASRAKRKGMKWNPYEGILSGGRWIPSEQSRDREGAGTSAEYQGGRLNQFSTEGELYTFLDLPFLEPKNRELDYLVKNFGQ